MNQQPKREPQSGTKVFIGVMVCAVIISAVLIGNSYLLDGPYRRRLIVTLTVAAIVGIILLLKRLLGQNSGTTKSNKKKNNDRWNTKL